MINMDAIKKKLAAISGNKGNAWKLKEGEYTVRIVPWRDLTKDGTIFHERYFYYNIKEFGVLSLHQFGQKDPVQELITKLREENTPETQAMAKQLYPNMRAYAAIIVRGEEDKGIRVWSFGKEVYERLLSFYFDEDICEVTKDITDPETGIDLKVKVKKNPGKTFLSTTVDPKLKVCKLSKEPKQAADWLAKMPKIDDMFTKPTYEELEKILNDWMNSGTKDGEGDDKSSSSEEASKEEAPSSKHEDDLEKALNELRS